MAPSCVLALTVGTDSSVASQTSKIAARDVGQVRPLRLLLFLLVAAPDPETSRRVSRALRRCCAHKEGVVGESGCDISQIHRSRVHGSFGRSSFSPRSLSSLLAEFGRGVLCQFLESVIQYEKHHPWQPGESDVWSGCREAAGTLP